MNGRMKFAAVFAAVLCFALVSCSAKSDKKDGKEQQSPKETQQQEQIPGSFQTDIKIDGNITPEKAVEILSAVPEYPQGYPTLEDVTLAYRKANMAVGWIIHTERVAVYDDDTLTVDGIEYKRVRPDCFYGADNLEKYKDKLENTQKLIFNFDCLEAYLCTLMSPDEAKEYITDAKDTNKFVEDENGNLYVLPFSYTPEGYGKEVYTLDDNGDGTYTFNVAYTLVDEDGNVYNEKNKSFDFVQIDGRWVFDRFFVIRQ